MRISNYLINICCNTKVNLLIQAAMSTMGAVNGPLTGMFLLGVLVPWANKNVSTALSVILLDSLPYLHCRSIMKWKICIFVVIKFFVWVTAQLHK